MIWLEILHEYIYSMYIKNTYIFVEYMSTIYDNSQQQLINIL